MREERGERGEGREGETVRGILHSPMLTVYVVVYIYTCAYCRCILRVIAIVVAPSRVGTVENTDLGTITLNIIQPDLKRGGGGGGRREGREGGQRGRQRKEGRKGWSVEMLKERDEGVMGKREGGVMGEREGGVGKG